MKNGKIRPVEIVPGMRGGGAKEDGRGGELNHDVFDIL
jgi:hypothetical protein